MTAPGQAACPELRALLVRAVDRPLEGPAALMARHLAERPGVVAVLFYGNMLRDRTAPGLLDFYVLTETDGAYHGASPAAIANRLLPPNVYHVERPGTRGEAIHAKVAVMTLAAFASRMRARSWDTTLWARFVQPVVLAHARDAAARDAVLEALARAARTAAAWAAAFAPAGADWRETWLALFQRTYGAELRVEGTARASGILDANPDHFRALFTLCASGGAPAEPLTGAMWRRRRIAGKLLNAARLMKAAATFRGGLAYALSKVERHSGRPVELSSWQRRWPWLAAPVVVLRLLWQRRLR